VHCCGFDSIPMDIGVFFLQQEAMARHGSYCKDIAMFVKATKGSASGGTLASMMNIIKEAKADRSVARILSDPYALNPEGDREGPDRGDQQQVLNDTEVDTLLVGDSLAMVMHGFDSTVHATVDLMALHVSAVARGAPNKFIVGDMPFLAARKGLQEAMDSVQQLMQAGAHSVKIEGEKGQVELMAHIVDSGVPVMGHLGLTPQSVHGLGGHKVQGKAEAEARALLDASLRVGYDFRDKVGAFFNIRYLGGGAEGSESNPTPPSDGFTKNWLHFITFSIGIEVRAVD